MRAQTNYDADLLDAEFDDATSGDLELEERHALRRVAGLSTELVDVTEVEYRQLRLELAGLLRRFHVDARAQSPLIRDELLLPRPM